MPQAGRWVGREMRVVALTFQSTPEVKARSGAMWAGATGHENRHPRGVSWAAQPHGPSTGTPVTLQRPAQWDQEPGALPARPADTTFAR